MTGKAPAHWGRGFFTEFDRKIVLSFFCKMQYNII